MKQAYYSLRRFLQSHFDTEIRKLPLHTFLGCPHRDSESGGGCIYCNDSGFSSINRQESQIRDQIVRGLTEAGNRGYTGRFIAYFQTGSNTCAEPDLLEAWWSTVLEFPQDIIGLSVSTRPDCLDSIHLDILNRLSEHLMIWLELGLQSANNQTLENINRGHDFGKFEQAVQLVKSHSDLHLVTHIILGLPGETKADMLHTIEALNRLAVDGIKMHHLQVVKNTLLAEQYRRGEVQVFDSSSYIQLLADLIPHVSERIVIHRLIGDTHPDLLIAPKWEKSKTQILQELDRQLSLAGLYQGQQVAG